MVAAKGRVAVAKSTKSKAIFDRKKGATIISGKVPGGRGRWRKPISTHAIFRPFFKT